MRNQLSLTEEDDNESSVFCWWRLAKEIKDNGHHLSIDLSKLSELTPRLKVLREMERLALVANEGMDDLRHKLLSYRSGDFCLPTGGIKKEEMNIPPITTILLVGFTGSGKSSLVNLMYSVLGRSGLIPFAQTSKKSSNYTTMFMEEHNVLRSVRSGFCVYDTKGLDYNQVDEGIDEFTEWMVDGIYHHQLCCRPEDGVFRSQASMESSKDSPLLTLGFKRRQVNYALVVANLAEIYKALMKGDSKPLLSTKELFYCPAIRKCNENPILILTHGDMLTTEERIDGRIKICELLGISETTGTYDIVCLTEHGFLADESDPVSAYGLTEAIYRALIFSDRDHYPKRKLKDWIILCMTWFMCALSTFFAYLAYIFSKLGHHNKLKLER
ncbi:P-loop containing nucleoside triphosphate hydrolases superfamily protein [Thalictrum thalictroides]|uniref:P-loop containing nucleoside triphosphate hydrolases superfamily protein n=1 Tax=Thalictrum thalictroides TaxID=46969 RepID=A0A7J6VY16_THATH|nr:P-loop containing nucleoside triphosphate hydrolases superfamily protein [Thalictrum thalictroides]